MSGAEGGASGPEQEARGEADGRVSPVFCPPATQQEKELAKKAYKEFLNRNYEATFKLLDRLSQTRSQDPLLVLNHSVTVFHAGGCRNTGELLKQLTTVCKLMDVDIDKTDSMDDVDQCVVYFNRAVIHYYCRKYSHGLQLAQRLFHYMEPLDETGMKKKVLSLLADLYLASHQPDIARGTMEALEKIVNGGEGTNKMTAAMQNRIARFKARAYLMMKSPKCCKRELKNLTPAASNDDIGTCIKANYEYLRGNFDKAMKYLSSSEVGGRAVTGPTQMTPAFYYNNLGCVHTMMRKHHMALFYFSKAMSENDKFARDLRLDTIGQDITGKPLQMVGVSRHMEILHNMGIQMLHAGRPVLAFESLVKCVHVFSNSPRLWLRLAECCIMTNRKSNDKDRDPSMIPLVVEKKLGSGVHTKVVLGQGTANQASSNESGGMPAPTYEFAMLSLQNANRLVKLGEAVSRAAHAKRYMDGEEFTAENIQIPCPPGNQLQGVETFRLQASILASAAYVSLCLNNPVGARKYAEELLAIPDLSPNHRYLGQMYLGEALLLEDRISEAVANLDPDSITEMGPGPPLATTLLEEKIEQERTLVDWTPGDLPTAHAFMKHNLAVCHAVRGEFAKADTLLTQACKDVGKPFPYQVNGLRLYLDLVQGRRSAAQQIIKEQLSQHPSVTSH